MYVAVTDYMTFFHAQLGFDACELALRTANSICVTPSMAQLAAPGALVNTTMYVCMSLMMGYLPYPSITSLH